MLATADIVLFLDCDVVILPTTFGDIMDILRKNPDAAGLIGSYDDSPGGKRMVSQFKFLLHHYIHQSAGEYVPSFWTGCGVIKKHIFKSLGGFNASFLDGASIHDVELGYRLRKNQYKIVNGKQILVKHLKELGFWEWMQTDVFVRGIPWIVVMLAYRNTNFILNVNFNALASVCCAWSVIFFLLMIPVHSVFLSAATIALIVWMILNRRVFEFFRIKKYFWFSIMSGFYLFIYYLNCGFCVLGGLFCYYFCKNHSGNIVKRDSVS